MKKISFFFLVILFASCTHEEKATEKSYFDVKGYFEKEAKRLNTLNPTIAKTVIENGKTEQKQVKIKDWGKEFKSFMDGDINKDAWRNQFKISKNGDTTVYTSIDSKISVKKLSIAIKNNQVAAIGILINNKNILYTSADTLTYLPGAYYNINKTQKIVLMSQKKYNIKGNFN